MTVVVPFSNGTPPNGTRGERNKNPGNLRYEPSIQWLGLDNPPSDADGYCRFVSSGMGIRALCKDMLSKWRRGLQSVRAIIEIYAPPTENNTAAYINDVCQRLAVSPEDEIDLTNNGVLAAMARAIIWHECGRVVYDPNTIAQAASMALAP